jgi:hypothetical protein
MTTTPLDFDPLSLDFPALTLQCLEPPPTLFSSTQHPTSTSWSILPPGKKQFEALRSWFAEEFRKWKITCQAATTAVTEDLIYPPSQVALKPDVREAVRKAEKVAENLEKQVHEHLESMYNVWEGLTPQRRQELWILELARGVGRKQKEVEQLKETKHFLKQENANLKSQIEHLNRLQQPREFKLMSPITTPIDRKFLAFALDEGFTHGKQTVGFTHDDRHSDLNTVVTEAIDRWKHVITATRAVSQRPLNAHSFKEAATSSGGNRASYAPNGTATSASTQPSQSTLAHSGPKIQQPASTQVHQRASATGAGNTYAASVVIPASENAVAHDRDVSVPTTGNTSAAVSVTADAEDDDMEDDEEEMSDQDADADADADAEMDDGDGFNTSSNQPQAHLAAQVSKVPPQHVLQQRPQPQHQPQHQQHQIISAVPPVQNQQLGVSRTRVTQQRYNINGPGISRSVTHAGIQGIRAAMGSNGRSATSIQAMQSHSNQQHRIMAQNHQARVAPADMGMVHSVGNEPMYMD